MIKKVLFLASDLWYNKANKRHFHAKNDGSGKEDDDT